MSRCPSNGPITNIQRQTYSANKLKIIKKSDPITTFGYEPRSYGGTSTNLNGRVSNPKTEKKSDVSDKIIHRPPKDFANGTKPPVSPLAPSSKDNKPTRAEVPTSVKSRANIFENNNQNTSPTSSSSSSKTKHSPSVDTKSSSSVISTSIAHPDRHGSSLASATRLGSSPATSAALAATVPHPGRPGRGLKNLGNTCFMNCILQCLSHTIPLREYFVSASYKNSLKSTKKGSLSAAFAKVLEDLWTSYTQSVAPYELKLEVGKVAPRFTGYSQHDAQEFMRFLLNEVHEEINRADVKGRQPPGDNETLKDACARYLTWEDSKVSELFCGMLRSTIRCTVCEKKSVVYDPFMDLALPIPKSSLPPKTRFSLAYDFSNETPVMLAECLKQFTDLETLDEDERPYCNKCNKSTKSTKQLSISKLPDILVIQLKRFSGYSVRRKLSTPVRFDETLILEDESRVKHRYLLYGTVSHSGGIYGGHYKAYCKYGEQWRCFNDSYVQTFDWQHVKSQEAYMLFYERRVTVDMSHI